MTPQAAAQRHRLIDSRFFLVEARIARGRDMYRARVTTRGIFLARSINNFPSPDFKSEEVDGVATRPGSAFGSLFFSLALKTLPRKRKKVNHSPL